MSMIISQSAGAVVIERKVRTGKWGWDCAYVYDVVFGTGRRTCFATYNERSSGFATYYDDTGNGWIFWGDKQDNALYGKRATSRYTDLLALEAELQDCDPQRCSEAVEVIVSPVQDGTRWCIYRDLLLLYTEGRLEAVDIHTGERCDVPTDLPFSRILARYNAVVKPLGDEIHIYWWRDGAGRSLRLPRDTIWGVWSGGIWAVQGTKDTREVVFYKDEGVIENRVKAYDRYVTEADLFSGGAITVQLEHLAYTVVVHTKAAVMEMPGMVGATPLGGAVFFQQDGQLRIVDFNQRLNSPRGKVKDNRVENQEGGL